jgi:hypothetical protein
MNSDSVQRRGFHPDLAASDQRTAPREGTAMNSDRGAGKRIARLHLPPEVVSPGTDGTGSPVVQLTA